MASPGVRVNVADPVAPALSPTFSTEEPAPPVLRVFEEVMLEDEATKMVTKYRLELSSTEITLNGYDSPGDVEGFSDDAYTEMLKDEGRTPVFEQAIGLRLAKSPPRTLTVLDIGTGPYAVLSIFAARAGARRGVARQQAAADDVGLAGPRDAPRLRVARLGQGAGGSPPDLAPISPRSRPDLASISARSRPDPRPISARSPRRWSACST